MVASHYRPELRATKRRSTAVRCWLQDGLVDRYARLADVSAGGARVVTAAPPEIGREVCLEFRLSPTGPDLMANGKVVWRTEGFHGRGGLMGVQFVSLSSLGAVNDYVERG